MNSRITIDDIAAAAGVSRQTVTRAMNGMPRISESTRARVLEVSERLGYRPNRFAANLARTAQVKSIGLVVDSFRNPYYGELTADLLEAAREHGWHVSLWSREQEPVLELLARIAPELDVVIGYIDEPDESKILTAARGTPVILVSRTAISPSLNSVDFDFQTGFRRLVNELRARGSRQFGFLDSHDAGTIYAPSSRRLAYEAVVDECSAHAVVVCDAPARALDGGERGMFALLDAFPHVDTVLAFSDLMAIGALRAARTRGLAVPADIRIVGIDGLGLGTVTSPTLTSLALVGRELTDALVAVVEGALAQSATATHRLIVPDICWRESA
ncbi:MAG TPA: LacI family DNA-binding transcriptional regulator [Candidatus Lumbricidophila sp.]|nr:LacI family DNA-binding transcriptional regulator [Candidatus Lumbricidophila sp.]